MTKLRSPQLGAAIALQQLLAEHPELQTAASWRVDRDGLLSGTVAHRAEQDMRPVMRAYAEVLGGQVHEDVVREDEDDARLSLSLYTMWRDVRVNVWASCLLSALAGEQVAA